MQIERKTLKKLTEDQIVTLNTHSLLSSIKFLKLWECCQGSPICWTLETDGTYYLIPGVEFGKFKLQRFQALPDGLYSQIISSQNRIDNSLIDLLLSEIAGYGYTKVFIYDFKNRLQQYKQYITEELETILVQLPESDWFPPDKKIQSELRKADRENVQIEKFDSEKHFDRFLTLMKDSEARHNREQKYPDKFYESLSELSKVDERIIWYWCEYEGKAVSSHINFVIQDMLFNWQVYYDKQFSFLKANQKMLVELVRAEKTASIQYLNLGASPPEADNLVSYKLKYGGETYSYMMLSKKNIIGKIL